MDPAASLSQTSSQATSMARLGTIQDESEPEHRHDQHRRKRAPSQIDLPAPARFHNFSTPLQSKETAPVMFTPAFTAPPFHLDRRLSVTSPSAQLTPFFSPRSADQPSPWWTSAAISGTSPPLTPALSRRWSLDRTTACVPPWSPVTESPPPKSSASLSSLKEEPQGLFVTAVAPKQQQENVQEQEQRQQLQLEREMVAVAAEETEEVMGVVMSALGNM